MKRGQTFVHKSWLTEDKKPLECVVTKVSDGVVYWRPVNGGKSMYFPLEKASRYVAGVCDRAFYDYVKQQVY